MDPELLRLASLQVGPSGDEGRPQRRGASPGALAKARAAKAKKKQEAEKTSQRLDPDAVVVASLCIPGCTGLLGEVAENALAPYRKRDGPLPLLAMCKLAVSAKVRGSGAVIDKVRRLQHLSSAMLGASALHLQEQGLQAWLRRAIPAGSTSHRVVGFALMWDEAEQKMKALLAKIAELKALSQTKEHAPATQTTVNVMVCLASVHNMTVDVDGEGHVSREYQWQPWLAAPLFLTSKNKDCILEGFARSMPVNVMKPEEASTWCRGPNNFFVATFCFDFAPSNLAAFRHMGHQLEEGHSAFLIHGERCATHCVHLVKSGCLSASQLSGMLYSISKLVTGNRVVNGLRHAIFEHVRGRLSLRTGPPPSNNWLKSAIVQVLGIDDDLSMMHFDSGGTRKPTTWFRLVEDMCANCHFDKNTGEWLFFAPAGPGLRQEGLLREAAAAIANPLIEVFVNRRWETAAFSRWTGVMRCLKRVSLGIIMNSVLPSALAKLKDKVGASQERLDQDIKKIEEQARSGAEVDNTMVQVLSRVLRVSAFFSDGDRKWQTGVTLITVSVVDKLHWDILGSGGKRERATLSNMVDPTASRIVATLAQLFDLLSGWHGDGA